MLAGALTWLYFRLNPVRSRLVVDFGAYGPDLVVPGASAGLTEPELRKALPNLDIVDLRSSNGAVTGKGKGASIFYLDSAMLSGGDGPFIADDRSRPDDSSRRRQPLISNESRPPSALEWLEPILEASKTRPTLLILDLSQPRVNWRAGVLAPFASFEFLGRLQSELDRRSKPGESPIRLAVLTSCRPGEQNWAEGGHSLFARSVIEALQGAADGANDGRTDGRVTAEEFGRYVRENVRGWVASHRAESGQHPIWMMAGADFDLAYVTGEHVAWPALPSGGAEVLDALEEAWKRRDAVWTATKEGIPAYSESPLDWRRANYLLSQAEACYRAADFKQAQRLLKDADESLKRLQPAATPSFDPPVAASSRLASFQADLPGGVPTEDFDSAVTTRAAAHTAATESPRSLVLIEGVLTATDTTRRQSEDALFRGDATTARQRRTQASQVYQSATSAAKSYDRACRGLERLLAGLPHLAEWAAAQPASNRIIEAFAFTPIDGSDVDLPRDGPAIVATLLVETQAIRQSLEELESASVPLDELAKRLGVVATRSDEAARRMAAFEASLSTEAAWLIQQVEKTDAKRLIRRRNIEQCLANCLLTGPTRRGLLEELADLDKDLRSSTIGSGVKGSTGKGPSQSDSLGWNPDDASQDLTQLAAWQGLWALLVRSLDPTADASRDRLWKDNWAIVAGQARLESAQRPSDAETGRKTAASLGDLLRIGWKASATEAARSRSFTGDPAKVQRDLVRRDRIARCLHGFDTVLLLSRAQKPNPANDLLAWNRSRLSLFLAQQSLDDFYAGTPGTSHWFESACRFHLDAASRFASPAVSPLISAEVAETETALNGRRGTRFWLQADQVVFGSYDKRSAELSVTIDGAPPAGSAAVWLASSGEGSAVRVGSEERHEVRVGEATSTPSAMVAIDLIRNTPSCDLIAFPARLFFRGHGSVEQRNVEANPCPPGRRIVVASPEPERGTLVVSGIDRRSILFVLDCSGSMKEALPDGDSKMDAAKSILETSVKDLGSQAKDGEGHRVGLVVLGHSMNRDEDGNKLPNLDWPAKERSRDPEHDYQVLTPIYNLTDGGAAPFRDALRREDLDSYGMTPLVNAIEFSLRQFQSDEPGTLVVVTDGADMFLGNKNLSDAQKASTRATLRGLSKSLAERKARGSAIEVMVVGFAVDKEQKASLAEVGDAVCKPSGGQLFSADNSAALLETLQAASKSRQYSVIPAGRNEGNSYSLDDESAPLPRGEYRIEFPDADPAMLTIAGGEHLVFDLKRDALVPRKYENGPAAGLRDRAVGSAGLEPNAPDMLVDRGYVFEAGKATLRLSLDRSAATGPNEGSPRVTREGLVRRPQEVWFDVTDGEGRRVQSLSWEIIGKYDLPTWTLTVPSAPSDQRLNVTARWSMRPTPQNAALVFGRPDIGKTFTVSTSEGHVRLTLKSFGRDEQRPGFVVARLEPAGGVPQTEAVRAALEDVWARIDEGPPGAGEFRPIETRTERIFFFDEGAIEFAFSVGSEVDASATRLGLVEPTAREQNATVATIRYQKAD
ncbi:MAG: VWA domain-containing protein [Planctomycetaceae bacterium]|nr:VWA domain-containing protein [Planctomycetaceae bacterium]